MICAMHIFTNMHLGDASRNFLDFLASYDRTELLVTVVLPYESPLVREVEKTGHPPILLRNIADPAHAFIGKRTLLKEIKRLSPDVIHTYGDWVKDALSKLTVPVVDEPNHLDSVRKKGRYAKMIAPSPWAKDAFIERKIDADKIALLPPGVLPPPELPEEEVARFRESLGFSDTDKICAVFHPMTLGKGYPLFFAAAQAASEECPNLKFVVLGGGAMRRQYMRKVVSLGLKKSIRFLSSEIDRTLLQNLMDFQVEISENRMLSRPLLEGMSLGKPAIAFRSGGNAFAVENGDSGFIADQFMSKKLMSAMVELGRNPGVLFSMGEAGKRRTEEVFSAEKRAENLVRLYREVLGTGEV